VETQSGLVAAWFGGTREKNPDVCIWGSRKEKANWSEPVKWADGIQRDGKPLPCWNPVLFQPREGDLLLFYKVGPSPNSWWGMLKNSKDSGKTWSEARKLPEGILGPIKNKPVQLASGDILSPTSTEVDGWRVYFERSSDLGKTWQATVPVNSKQEMGAIQPSILFLNEQKLLAVGRTRQGRVFQITSDDAGKIWGKMSLSELPNPNSGTDAVTLKDGRHLLVYNHSTLFRSPLNVAVSKDGNTWQAALVLENEPGEYSYPAVIESKDGLVHVVYTWKRKKIKHVTLDPSKFELKEMKSGQWPN
jgi:predicted neuraminidase